MSPEKEIEYETETVTMVPSRKFRRGEKKYAPIINNFLEASAENKSLIQTVKVKGKETNYTRTQLNKIIVSDDLPLSASVVNNVLYLSRTDIKKKNKKLE